MSLTALEDAYSSLLCDGDCHDRRQQLRQELIKLMSNPHFQSRPLSNLAAIATVAHMNMDSLDHIAYAMYLVHNPTASIAVPTAELMDHKTTFELAFAQSSQMHDPPFNHLVCRLMNFDAQTKNLRKKLSNSLKHINDPEMRNSTLELIDKGVHVEILRRYVFTRATRPLICLLESARLTEGDTIAILAFLTANMCRLRDRAHLEAMCKKCMARKASRSSKNDGVDESGGIQKNPFSY